MVTIFHSVNCDNLCGFDYRCSVYICRNRCMLCCITERRSGILEVGNTPKGTPLAQSLLHKITRKSLIISLQNCEKNSLMPSDSKTGNLETVFAEPETSVPPPDGDHQTRPDVSNQAEPTELRSRKSKRLINI